jgi:hypothetical protein
VMVPRHDWLGKQPLAHGPLKEQTGGKPRWRIP